LDENGRCALCRLGMTGYDAVYSYGSYEGTLRTLVHLYKFEKIHTLAKPLAGFMARVLPRQERFDVVVPVPLHWRRRWQRGFNQSELLAREIARRWNAPVVKAVHRLKPTSPQSGLTNAKRRANVAGAFGTSPRWSIWPARREPRRLEGARVLLVDDVLTTGATAAACARLLKRAGAKHVAVLTVARTDRRFASAGSESSMDSHAAPAASIHSNSAVFAAGGSES
jgi:competence protein ComFC